MLGVAATLAIIYAVAIALMMTRRKRAERRRVKVAADPVRHVATVTVRLAVWAPRETAPHRPRPAAVGGGRAQGLTAPETIPQEQLERREILL